MQHEIVRVEAVRPLAFDALHFGPTQVRLDGADDIQGDFVLNLENVIERTVEALAPKMASAFRLDHLRGDAHTTVVFAYASLKQVSYAEFATHAFHVHRHTFVGEAGIARDHEQPLDA